MTPPESLAGTFKYSARSSIQQDGGFSGYVAAGYKLMMRPQTYFQRSMHPTVASSSRRMPWTHLGWPVLVATLGILATVVATAATWRSVEQTDQERFLRGVEQAHTAMLDRMDTYIAVIRATAALFAASEQVTRTEFSAFVEKLTLGERYPGIQGIGFSIHVPPGQVARIEADMRTQGVEGFRVWPDDPREEVNSIIYIEPMDRRNRVAIGFDMSVDPVRRAAMERAREFGRARRFRKGPARPGDRRAGAGGLPDLRPGIPGRRRPGHGRGETPPVRRACLCPLPRRRPARPLLGERRGPIWRSRSMTANRPPGR